jgi:hypothetical protein
LPAGDTSRFRCRIQGPILGKSVERGSVPHGKPGRKGSSPDWPPAASRVAVPVPVSCAWSSPCSCSCSCSCAWSVPCPCPWFVSVFVFVFVFARGSGPAVRGPAIPVARSEVDAPGGRGRQPPNRRRALPAVDMTAPK